MLVKNMMNDATPDKNIQLIIFSQASACLTMFLKLLISSFVNG